MRLPDGEVVALFQSPLPPPYICFMVVTKHLNNEDLFSTKYQLSFSSLVNRYDKRERMIGILLAFSPNLLPKSPPSHVYMDVLTMSELELEHYAHY